MKERIETLKLMHETMRSMNDEEAYYSWIVVGVPDEPNKYDYEGIAEDDESYADTVDSFYRIFSNHRIDGLYNPSQEVINFCKGIDPNIAIYY